MHGGEGKVNSRYSCQDISGRGDVLFLAVFENQLAADNFI